MKKIALLLAFVTLGLAGCGDGTNNVNGAWRNSQGRTETVKLPAGGQMVTTETRPGERRITIFDKDGNIPAGEAYDREYPVARASAAAARTTIVPQAYAPAPVRSRASLAPASDRPASCKIPCDPGYSHAPRPGSPCGCGR